MVVPNTFEKQIEIAYSILVASVTSEGPHDTGTHKAYVIRGLAETPEQLVSLCWCILSFLDKVNEVDFKLESIIGSVEQAGKNLKNALATYFDIGVELAPSQESKDRKRNPLIAEFISHILVHIHREKSIFPAWIGEVQGCKNPHSNVNDGGLDLIALGNIDSKFLPALGEVKAYEDDPAKGLNDACKKFTQIRNGIYNQQIRGALSSLNIKQGLSKEALAANIWERTSNFGAFVSFDQQNQFDITKHINRNHVKIQPPDRLFLIVTPYTNMEKLFDRISDTLLSLANSFDGQK